MRRAGSGWCFARSLPPPACAQSRDFWLCRSASCPSAIMHVAQHPLNAGVPSSCAHRPWLFPPNPRSTLLTGTRSPTRTACGSSHTSVIWYRFTCNSVLLSPPARFWSTFRGCETFLKNRRLLKVVHYAVLNCRKLGLR